MVISFTEIGIQQKDLRRGCSDLLPPLSFFKCNWVFVGNLQGQRCTESTTMS